MTSCGREPKIYLRGVTPHTHTWWPRPPPLLFEELSLIGDFIAYLLFLLVSSLLSPFWCLTAKGGESCPGICFVVLHCIHLCFICIVNFA